MIRDSFHVPFRYEGIHGFRVVDAVGLSLLPSLFLRVSVRLLTVFLWLDWLHKIEAIEAMFTDGAKARVSANFERFIWSCTNRDTPDLGVSFLQRGNKASAAFRLPDQASLRDLRIVSTSFTLFLNRRRRISIT